MNDKPKSINLYKYDEVLGITKVTESSNSALHMVINNSYYYSIEELLNNVEKIYKDQINYAEEQLRKIKSLSENK